MVTTDVYLTPSSEINRTSDAWLYSASTFSTDAVVRHRTTNAWVKDLSASLTMHQRSPQTPSSEIERRTPGSCTTNVTHRPDAVVRNKSNDERLIAMLCDAVRRLLSSSDRTRPSRGTRTACKRDRPVFCFNCHRRPVKRPTERVTTNTTRRMCEERNAPAPTSVRSSTKGRHAESYRHDYSPAAQSFHGSVYQVQIQLVPVTAVVPPADDSTD